MIPTGRRITTHIIFTESATPLKGDCRAEDAFMQVYRPLYEEAYTYRNGGLFDLRPLHMFFEAAERKGKKVPRFTTIVDP